LDFFADDDQTLMLRKSCGEQYLLTTSTRPHMT